MAKGKVVMLMGSEKNIDFCREIADHLKVFDLTYEFRVGSAHKMPEKVLEILREYEGENVVYITVAGRSNALSAFVDTNTVKPVIACQPYSEKFGGADVYSSLRVPSGVGSAVSSSLEAQLLRRQNFALEDESLAKGVKGYQQQNWKLRRLTCLLKS